MVSHKDLLSDVRRAVHVTNEGIVSLRYPVRYLALCRINAKDFPVDRQTCFLNVSSWDYPASKLRLRSNYSYLLDHYEPNVEWSLVKASLLTRDSPLEGGLSYTVLDLAVDLQRRPFFYVTSLWFPAACVSLITLVGLFASHSSDGVREEKFSMGLSAVLAMTILALIVEESVPQTDNLPLLCGYFVGQVLLITLATLTTGLAMRAHKCARRPGARPPPPLLLRLLGLASAPATPRSAVCPFLLDPEAEERCGCLSRLRKAILDYVREGQAIADKPQDWAQVASRLDSVACFIFLLLSISLTLYFFISTSFFGFGIAAGDPAVRVKYTE
jgi:nicotinic acetylcholine receptor alpha-7